MKFAYAVIGLVLTVQNVFSAPVDGEELTDPKLRGFLETVLEAISRPILSGLPSTGQGIINPGSSLISSAINAVSNTGGNFLNTPLGPLNSIIPYTNTRPTNQEQLLDIINGLVDEFNSEGHIGATVDESGNDSIVSQDEIMELLDNESSSDEKKPTYVVLLDDLLTGLK